MWPAGNNICAPAADIRRNARLAIESSYIRTRGVIRYFRLISGKRDVDSISRNRLLLIAQTRDFSRVFRETRSRNSNAPSRSIGSFTVVDLMDLRAIHRVHAVQQPPILQLVFPPEENHDSDIQPRICTMICETISR